MTSSGWHIEPALAERYWQRNVDPALAASIDAHLMYCETCRDAVGDATDARLTDMVWGEIVDALDRPRLGVIERAVTALGCSEATSRIVAATTRARWSYLFVVVASLTMALVSAVSVSRSDDWFACFLLIAPLGPLVATAGAFGRLADPAHHLLRTLPTSSLRIILIRTVAGVAPAIVLTALATPWLLDRGWMAAAWLLPSLAITILILALSTWFDVEVVAAALAGIWIGVPVVLRLPFDDLLDAFSGPVQAASIAVALLAGATGVMRRSEFDRGGR